MASQREHGGEEGKPRANIFRRIARVPVFRRSSRPKPDAGTYIDYHARWPTVSTLVTQQSDSDGEEHHPTPVKVKAMEAMVVPLEWLTDKLESISERLDQKATLAVARAAEKRAGVAPSRKASLRPGQSTHPYDTGVGAAQDHQNGSRYQTAESLPEQPRISMDSQRHESAIDSEASTVKTPAKVRFRHQSIRTTTCRHSRPIRSMESPPARPLSPIHGSRHQDDEEAGEEIHVRSEKPGRPLKRWWRRSSAAVNETVQQPPRSRSFRSEGVESMQKATPPEPVPDKFDSADIPQPRSAWKCVRGRRASVYPGKDREHVREKRKHEEPLAASLACRRKGQPEPSPPSSQHPPAGGVSPPRERDVRGLSRQSSGLRSDAQDFAVRGTSSGGTPRSGALRQWFNLLGGRPPSRTISPLELAQGGDPEQLPPRGALTSCRTGRRSTDTMSTPGTDRGARIAGGPLSGESTIMPCGHCSCDSKPRRSPFDADSSGASYERRRDGWLGHALKLGSLTRDTALSNASRRTTPESGPSHQQSGKATQ